MCNNGSVVTISNKVCLTYISRAYFVQGPIILAKYINMSILYSWYTSARYIYNESSRLVCDFVRVSLDGYYIDHYEWEWYETDPKNSKSEDFNVQRTHTQTKCSSQAKYQNE